jgi:hypothetical protein
LVSSRTWIPGTRPGMTALKMGAIGSPADAWISQNSLEEEIFQCFGEFHKIAYWICRLR